VSELVRRGEVTLGIRYQRDASPDGVCTEMKPERLVVTCGASHRLAGKRVASLELLREEPWLAFPGSDEQREASADNVFAHSWCAASRRRAGPPSTA
jgi:DNA-binding transcriptional LysR family regulator